MDADKLLIVAHPDDELLWGGANLLREPGWLVVCATNAEHPVRSKEFAKTMSFCNATQFKMYNVKDVYTEDDVISDRLFVGSEFETRLTDLAKQSWKVVLTHNEQGEYGHAHHKSVHRLVLKYFPDAKTFEPARPLHPDLLEVKRTCGIFYAKTQDICGKMFRKEYNTLRPVEKELITKEALYVPRRPAIPKVIHQVWFGSELDLSTPRGFLMNRVKEVAERNGFVYKRWSDAERNADVLPITHEYIEKALEFGRQKNSSRWAQVADLARYELLHRYGGVYLDSLFEISDNFCRYIEDKSTTNDIIVANEDPCGLECEGAAGHYMSNGFFGCIPGCVILKRLIHPDTLAQIDLDLKFINRTTGPYYLRMGIVEGRDKYNIVPTEKIYPFMVNDSLYRQGSENKCLEDGKIIDDCLESKYPGSLTVYHSGLGGSWSW
jgi:LmbE family N-acetylglucosaminyl deacetylase